MSFHSLPNVLRLHRASLLGGDTPLAYVEALEELHPKDEAALDGLRRMRDGLLRSERLLLGLRLLHAGATGLGVFAFAVIAFVLRTPAVHAAALLAVGLVAFPALTILSLVSLWAKKRTASVRNTIARDLYKLGLRIDGRGRLVTNAAHPSVILPA